MVFNNFFFNISLHSKTKRTKHIYTHIFYRLNKNTNKKKLQVPSADKVCKKSIGKYSYYEVSERGVGKKV